jgi:hypothetical protein
MTRQTITDKLEKVKDAGAVQAALKQLKEAQEKSVAFSVQLGKFQQKMKVFEDTIAGLRGRIDEVLSDAGDPCKLSDELRSKESERRDLQELINALEGKASAFIKKEIPKAEKMLFDAVTVEMELLRATELQEVVDLCDMLVEKFENWNTASGETYKQFFPDGRTDAGTCRLTVPQRFQSSLFNRIILQQ